jgi:hypothetical protein
VTWFCGHARPREHCVSCAENMVVRNADLVMGGSSLRAALSPVWSGASTAQKAVLKTPGAVRQARWRARQDPDQRRRFDRERKRAARRRSRAGLQSSYRGDAPHITPVL